MKVGIIGAMDVEVELLHEQLADVVVTQVAGTEYWEGTLTGVPVVVVKCGIGKVNAGICVQALRDRFGVTHVINTGVAGSLDARLDIGDLVVSVDCVQHDFTVGPLGYAPGWIPGRDGVAFEADEALREGALAAAAAVAPEVSAVPGRVASGDQFISAEEDKRRITETFGAVCCEMEGAAVAQAACANGVPFVVVRAISDKAGTDEQFSDYETFERESAHRCARIVSAMVAAL